MLTFMSQLFLGQDNGKKLNKMSKTTNILEKVVAFFSMLLSFFKSTHKKDEVR